MRVHAFISVWLIAATALAVSRTDAASLTAKGVASMEAGEFEAALRHLDAASTAAGDDATLARVHLLRAQCFAALRDFAKVEAALGRALEYDPDVIADAQRTPPRVVTLLEAVRKKARGVLRVHGEGSGHVFADGKPIGSPPMEVSLPIGKTRIEVRDPGGRVVQGAELILRPNRPTDFAVAPFEWAPAPEPPPEPKLTAQAPPPPEPPPPPPVPKPQATPSPVSTTAESKHEPPPSLGWTAEGRAYWDPGWGASLEAGGGLGGRHWRATVDATFGAAFGLTARGAVTFPDLVGPVGLYASADVPVFFYQQIGVGLGGSVGIGVTLISHLEVFAEGAGRWFVMGPSNFRNGYLLAAAGFRWRPE